jgi:phosphatidylserine/phosphatidylglycerophosphate/cardiolipin synthase-like enzyme
MLELEWTESGTTAELDLPNLDRDAILPLRASQLMVLRTQPRTQDAPGVFEVKDGFIGALRNANELIYIETQYFTSRSITAALVERMRDQNRPRLQVAIVVPRTADNSKEAFALGDIHKHMLAQLQAAAKEHGHELYVLCSVGGPQADSESTFIHSKLLLIDDVYLSIGSANMTERSLGFDTELCLVWNAGDDDPLKEDIRRLRRSLLAEHAGHAVAEDPDLRMGDEIRHWLGSTNSRLRACQYECNEAATPNVIKSWIFDPGGPAELDEARQELVASQLV